MFDTGSTITLVDCNAAAHLWEYNIIINNNMTAKQAMLTLEGIGGSVHTNGDVYNIPLTFPVSSDPDQVVGISAVSAPLSQLKGVDIIVGMDTMILSRIDSFPSMQLVKWHGASSTPTAHIAALEIPLSPLHGVCPEYPSQLVARILPITRSIIEEERGRTRTRSTPSTQTPRHTSWSPPRAHHGKCYSPRSPSYSPPARSMCYHQGPTSPFTEVQPPHTPERPQRSYAISPTISSNMQYATNSFVDSPVCTPRLPATATTPQTTGVNNTDTMYPEIFIPQAQHRRACMTARRKANVTKTSPKRRNTSPESQRLPRRFSKKTPERPKRTPERKQDQYEDPRNKMFSGARKRKDQWRRTCTERITLNITVTMK